MKRQFVLFALTFLFGVSVFAEDGKKFSVYAVGFYNLENLFDTCHDEGKKDYDFLPDGSYKWDGEKYSHKLRNMARVLAEMATDSLTDSVGCAAIGVSEVENARCLTELCAQQPLAERDMRFCHVEGIDDRGIDCALLYNPALFTVRDVKLVPYVPEEAKDSNFHTRGFLTVSGTMADEHVTVIVCHLPSRFSGSAYRETGARQIKAVKDSLIKEDPGVKVIVMGDMNDDPADSSMAVSLGAKREIAEVGSGDMYNPWWNVLAGGKGTLFYRGAWNLFDQIILSPSLLGCGDEKQRPTLRYFRHQIFSRDYMLQQEGNYKGSPKRTTARGVWLDGYSDHLPTVVYLIKDNY